MGGRGGWQLLTWQCTGHAGPAVHQAGEGEVIRRERGDGGREGGRGEGGGLVVIVQPSVPPPSRTHSAVPRDPRPHKYCDKLGLAFVPEQMSLVQTSLTLIGRAPGAHCVLPHRHSLLCARPPSAP